MSYVTANGAPVMSAKIVRPRVGVWHADLSIDSREPDQFAGAISIILADQLAFQGFARRSGIHHGTVHVRMVGGAGGLPTMLQPRSWQNVPLRIPLADALSAAGERLSPTADVGTLNTLLPKWSRPQRGAGDELGALVAAVPGAAWRVLSDGSIWLGPETWPAASLEWQEIDYDPAQRRLELASDVPTLSPGQLFPAGDEIYSGLRISMVEHQSAGEVVRHFVHLEDTGAPPALDRLKKGLTDFIRNLLGARVDALALYPARVVAQNADGTLELRPDDSRWPGFSRVPIRYGLPGTTAKVPAGTRVLVGFAGGDVRQPVVTCWESGSITEIDLGGTGGQWAAMGQDVRDELDAIWTAIGAHTHPGNGSPATPASYTKTTKTVKATVVKVK